jgi:hypothetical protein
VCNYTAVGPEFDPVSFNDNCPGTTILNNFNSAATLAGAQFPKGVTTVTWTATDAAGLTATCSFTITVTDNQPPSVTCPAGSPFVRNTDLNQCYYTVQGAEFNPTFNDNCSGTVILNNFNNTNTLANAHLPKGSTTVTWTATDATGFTATCSLVVNVNDNQPPTINCPLNIVTNNTSGYCFAGVTVPNPSMTDNCDVSTLTWVMTGATTGSSPATGINYVGFKQFNVGVTNVTYTVIDATGNSSDCSFTVTVNDIQPPTLICPPGNPFLRGTVSAGCYYIVQGSEFDPAFSDNCPGTVIINSLNGSSTLANVQLPLGANTITWTATDAAGLITNCFITVNVVDNTPPVITCPTNFSVQCPSDIPEPDPNLVSAWDNCGFVSVTFYNDNYLGLGIIPGFCPTGVERTYRATDGNGNVTDCVQLITVLDECDCPTCQTHVPHFYVNLSGNPDSTWVSPSIGRQGLCCKAKSPDRCISFSVMIDENTIGIFFLIDGATPPGHYYQIDCGPITPMNEIICIPPGEYHTITFCKPGANENVYTIQAVPGLLTPMEITTRIACQVELTVSGVIESTVSWNDITGGGIYNSYLSCDTGCLTTYFTADNNSPPIVDYMVCGEVAGNPCNNGVRVCDTVRVNVFPAIEITVQPYPAVFCYYSPQTMYATVSPPSGYDIKWWDAWNGTGNIVSTTYEYKPTAPGNYSITIVDYVNEIPCSRDTLNFEVFMENCISCPEQFHCGEEDIVVYSTVSEFFAAGGQMNFPCEVLDNNIALVNQQSDSSSCPTHITHTYEIWDICGNKDRCDVLITLNDTIPPTFLLPDLSDKTCVADIYHAVYNPDGSYEENTDLTYPRPNYFLLADGNTLLDITDMNDNCTDPEQLSISWELDFGNDGTFEMTGSGQLSEPPPNFFPVGETMIRWTVSDGCSNETTQSMVLVVWPRPDIIDN